MTNAKHIIFAYIQILCQREIQNNLDCIDVDSGFPFTKRSALDPKHAKFVNNMSEHISLSIVNHVMQIREYRNQ